MAAKEIKGYLKKAKAEIDKQDYESVKRCCKDVFRLDATNYTGLVFAGLAALKLSEYNEAKEYYNTAITSQPEGRLAWKGFADYYDHYKPVIKDDQVDAIRVYKKLLQFTESDVLKARATLSKLISLHKELNEEDEVVRSYCSLLRLYEGSLSESEASEVSRVSLDFVEYVIVREKLVRDHWQEVQARFGNVEEGGAKQKLRGVVIRKAYGRYMEAESHKEQLQVFVLEECVKLLDGDHLSALPFLLHLTLTQLLPGSVEELRAKELVLTDSQRAWLSVLESGADVSPRLLSLWWAGQALVGVADHSWEAALDCISKSVAVSGAPCECWCLSSLLCLYRRDYQKVESSVTNGLKCLSKSAKSMSARLNRILKLCQCEAYLGKQSAQQLQDLVPFLTKLHQDGCGQHETTIIVRARLLLGDVTGAEEVIEGSREALGSEAEPVVCGLRAEVAAAKKDLSGALERVNEGLALHSSSPELLFLKAKIMWESPDVERSQVYAVLVKAAKADPHNPDVFHYLGDYHRLATGDFKRAEKCYSKALSMQPSHREAAMGLGEVLWANGEQDRAFQVYIDVTAVAPPHTVKKAWLRVGLHQKDSGHYDDAIKSFQTLLAVFPEDRQCWDCLGEAYLARGSFNAALRTFTMCAQLEPESLHYKYRMARVKQTLGLVTEAIEEFSSILDTEQLYFPALFGRGECYVNQAHLAIQQNFDGRAVDCVGKALNDLSLAAQLHPEFQCVWKLLGDSCVSVHPVSPAVCSLVVPSVLCGRKGDEQLEGTEVGKVELLQIGCRCYEKSLQINKEAAHFWHDLAQGYFHLGKCLGAGSSDGIHAFNFALRAAEKAVDLKPMEFTYWNTLGVIAASEEVNSPGLAQHSFIHSLQEQETSLAWSNLGALYLKHDKAELAYEAFKKAQAFSPESVQAWTGQALIAERIGSDETMDLFRHATELDYHPEASMGYGYWVCQTLQTVPLHRLTEVGGVELHEEAHRGVARARDSLDKLRLRNPRSACALNYLGLLCEQEGRARHAQELLVSAMQFFSTGNEQEMIAANLARIQSCLGEVSAAIALLETVSKTVTNLQFELALANFRVGNWNKSQQAYRAGIKAGDVDKSAVLTAQAMVAYASGDRESCKQYLFEAAQTTPVCIHGLVSLCALACICKDSRLLQATLMELSGILEWQEKEKIHMLHPSCLHVLRAMEYWLSSPDFLVNGLECRELVGKLIQNIPEQTHTNLAPPSPLYLHLILKSSSPILSQAQKLVHSYPDNVWALSTLTEKLDEGRVKDSYRIALLELVNSMEKSEMSEFPNTALATPWKSGIFKCLTSLYSSLVET